MTATRGPCSPWDPIWCCDLTSESPITTGQALLADRGVVPPVRPDLRGRASSPFGPADTSATTTRGGAALAAGGNWSYGGFGFWPMPALIGGNWFNLTCGGCSGTCSCTELSEALLPSPVSSIVSVKLDGVTLPASGVPRGRLPQTGALGGEHWPECQDLDAGGHRATTPGLSRWWSARPYRRSARSPSGSSPARSAAPASTSAPSPARASSITRQGVTIDLVTITELLRNGLTGLRWVDQFVSVYNPRRLMAPPLVFDVDGERYRRTNT